MIEIGRVCVKIAGRDAGLKCVVVDDLGKGFVMIDGQTRRRKCSIRHLEPLSEKLKIGRKAGHDEVVREFKKLKTEIMGKKEKKKKTEKPVKQRGRKKQMPPAEKKEAQPKSQEKDAKKQPAKSAPAKKSAPKKK